MMFYNKGERTSLTARKKNGEESKIGQGRRQALMVKFEKNN